MRAISYFFDVPVYRLPEEAYYAARDLYVAEVMDGTRRSAEADRAFKAHLEKGYGGPWTYNEIIGYIKLFFMGSQVRGEYFQVDAKRIVKTRTKTMWLVAHKLAPELEIPRAADSAEILAVIRRYLKNCERELPRRYVDLEMFDAIAPYVNWRQLWLDA